MKRMQKEQARGRRMHSQKKSNQEKTKKSSKRGAEVNSVGALRS